MANDNKEIGEIVKKCKILLLDIEGTTTSISFVKDKLFPYAEENVKQFLESKWEEESVKDAVTNLRKLAVEDQEKSVEGVVSIPGEDASKEDQVEGLVKNVKWQMSSDRKVGALKQLQGLIWKQGYDNGDIKGHVYDDVSPALEQWRSVEDQKVYIYSSGSVQAQKLLFGQSLSGDLLKFIDGHFDTAVGAKQEPASYVAIAEKIGVKPEEILFLTDIVKEAEAARASGLHAALVSREGNAPLPDEATAAFPVLHSFQQLTVTNKRKTDPQDEQPAKVPKTDVSDDVKTNSEAAAETALAEVVPAVSAEETDKPEKMEVESEPTELNGASTEKDKSEETATRVETTVEEITDTEVGDAAICDVEPIIEEKSEKTEEKQTEEKMETETTDKVDSVPEAKTEEAVKNGETGPVVEEITPGTVITEIEELSSDKPSLGEVAEIIEDLEPVVEEPPAVEDMEELQNVGEVLEKECDEILSKVQDVTNLDNIPIKPLLNTIAEETMETDNVDSNDIVDRILDTELELEMKQCGDIDLNVEPITSETKTDVKEKEESSVEKTVNSEEKPAETVVEVKTVTKETETSSSTESKKDVKMDESEPEKIPENDMKVDTPVEKSDTATEKQNDTSTPTENSSSTETEQPKCTKESVATETDMVIATKDQESAAKEEDFETLSTEKAEVNGEKVTENESSKKENDASAKENNEPAKQESENSAPTVESNSTKDNEVPVKENDVVVQEKDESTKDEAPQEKAADEKKEEVKEPQVNGKTTNGDAKTASLNGDASKDEELSARLSVENGKEVVNGTNGDSNDAEKAQGDNKMEADVADIKVKTVATDEPPTAPIEQPTEA